MADVNANIDVNIDTSDALRKLKSLQAQISKFHTSISRSSEAAALAQKSLQKNLLNSVNAIGAFSAELRTVKTTAESFTSSLEGNKFSMREYFRYAGGATKTFGKLFKSEFDTIGKVAEDRVRVLQTQYIKLGRDASGAMKALAIIPDKLDMTNQITQTQIAAQKQAIFNQLMKQGSTNLLNFGKNTQWAGRQLMVGFSLPLASFGMAASKTFMDMEAQALRFKKVYGDLFTPPAEAQQQLDAVKNLGKEFTKYGVAVSDTVGLAAEAAAAGFQGIDLQRQTTAATRLAVLGQIDNQQALQTTISLQSAFNTSSADLANTIDFLNAVENQTVTSLDDITVAIPKVAPVIKQLGGNVKDLAFFLTAMKEGGVNASEGANALKSGLAAIINPTTKATAMLSSMGININKIVESNKGDLKATIISFAQALDTLAPLERARAIETMFGKFQFARLSTLFQNVTKDGTQAARVLDLANSSVEDLASLSEKELGMTAESAMNKFKKSVEDLKLTLIPVGETFLKSVTPIIDFVSGILDKFNNLSDGTKKFITLMTVGVAGIGPILLMTFGLLANGVANIIKLFLTLRQGYLRLTGQSQVLGEQTQYLTTEQLNAQAAAHSLNQSHANLTQTFNVEKQALTQLIAAYESATRAASSFALANPGMMIPKIGKKYAKGKPYVVGGSGNKDSEPAMLTPGETVIPAKMSKKYGGLINGIIADNIPGYQDGLESQFAHITERSVISIGEFYNTLKALPAKLQESKKATISEIEDIMQAFGKDLPVNIYSGLGIRQGANINQAMKNGGQVSIQEFLQDYDKQGIAKWTDALKIGGMKLADVSDELGSYDTALKKTVQDFMTLQGKTTITSKEFAKLEAELRQTLPATSKLRQGLTRAERTITEYRINFSRGLVEEAGLPIERVPSKKDPSKMSSKWWTRIGRSRIRSSHHATSRVFGGYGETEGFAYDAGTQMVTGATQGVQTAQKSQSPSKVAEQLGFDFGEGYAQGIEKSAPIAQAASRKLVDGTIRDTQNYSIKRMRRARGRRVATRAQGPANIGPEMPIGAAALPIVAQPTERDLRRTRIRNTARGVAGRVRGVATRFATPRVGLGVSSALMMGSMLPGVAGQISGTLSQIGFFGQAIAMLPGPLKLAAVAAGGLYVAHKLLSAAAERSRVAIEGLGDIANLSGDKLKNLDEYFGVTPTISPFEQDGTANPMAPQQMSEVQRLRTSDLFKKDFKVEINTLKKATDEEAKAALDAIAQKLAGRGYTTEQINTFLRALQQEAGKTSLDIRFESIDLTTKEGQAGFKKSVDGTVKLLEDSLITGMKKVQIDVQKYNPVTGNIDWAKKTITAFTDDAKKKVNLASQSITAMITGLSAQLASGRINAEQFRDSFASITTAIEKMPKAQGLLMVDYLMRNLPENLRATARGLNDVNGQMMILEAKALGMENLSGLIESWNIALNGFGPEQALAKQRINAFKKDMKERGKLVQDLAKSTMSAVTEGGGADTLSKEAKLTIARLEQELRGLKKKQQIIKDTNDELKRQYDYQQKLMNLQQEAVQAKISGNYIGASIIEQQKTQAMVDFKKETDSLALDKKITALENRINDLRANARVNDAEKAYLKAQGKVPGKALGGLIKGPGTAMSDSIKARVGFAAGGMINLSNGEYVMRTAAVRNYGVGFMNAVNKGALQASPATNGTVYNIDMTINGGNNNPNEIANQVIKKLKAVSSANNKSNMVTY